MYNTMADELVDQDFISFSKSFLVRSKMAAIFSNPNSIWYDDVATDELNESRNKFLRNHWKMP